MRLEQALRENLDAMAGALVVPGPRRVPDVPRARRWKRPVAFAAAGALAAVALVVVPALLIGRLPSESSPLGSSPVTQPPATPPSSHAVPTTSDTSVASTTTTVEPVGRLIGDFATSDYVYRVWAMLDDGESVPPTSTLVLLASDRETGETVSEVTIAEPGMFFWNTVTGPGPICSLDATSSPKGDRVAIQVLLSPSLGCSDVYVFEHAEAVLAPVETSAEDVAQLFVEAWRQQSDSALASLASEAIVKQVSEVDLVAAPTLIGCEGAAGSVYCTWEADIGDLTVRVSNLEPPPVVLEVTVDPAG